MDRAYVCMKISEYPHWGDSYQNAREHDQGHSGSPPQFENRIMARVYVRGITRSTMYQKARTGVWKISYVACGFSSIKIEYSDYLKSLISRINEAIAIF